MNEGIIFLIISSRFLFDIKFIYFSIVKIIHSWVGGVAQMAECEQV
jgi:hypothetical protein